MVKIKYSDAAYIYRYRKEHFMEKHFGVWYIEKRNETHGTMALYVKWWFYLLTFIPAHILKLLYCAWDGGLKEFSIERRLVSCDNIIGLSHDDVETQFGRFKKVWEKYNEANC